MKTFSSLIRIGLQLLVIAAIASCGGGAGEPDRPPAISNLTYSPSTAPQAPNGTVAINGTVDFADAG